MTNVPHACWVSIIGWVHLFQKMTWAYEKDASQELCMWIMSIIISIMWIMEGWWLLSHDAHGFFQPILHQVPPRGLPKRMAERRCNTRPRESNPRCTDISSCRKSRTEPAAMLCWEERSRKSTCQPMLSWTVRGLPSPRRTTTTLGHHC